MAKIIIVDDEPDMLWALTNVLISENHSVIAVSNGEEALAKVKQVAVDLVLLDLRLPGMDGIQVLEKIKEIKPDLPVVMVTGYGGIEEAVQSIKLGAFHYLPKPFDNNRLIEIVNQSLQLNSLKKAGVFGERVVEGIELRSASAKKAPTTSQEKVHPLKLKKILKPVAFAAIVIVLGILFYKVYEKNRDYEYLITNSRISGLSWSGKNLWVSDWVSQTVQQYQLQDNQLVLIGTFLLPGYHLTGIAWGNGYIYTCDSWKKKIFKHYPNSTLSVAESYPSPGPNPSGLFYDGKYLWSCDGDTRKIYQHVPDSQLTIVSTYESSALFPVGLYYDKNDFWVASAKGMKIFKNSLREGFKLEKTFVFPDSFKIAQQISAFTLEKGKIWITYEGVNKIYRKNLKGLQEVSP